MIPNKKQWLALGLTALMCAALLPMLWSYSESSWGRLPLSRELPRYVATGWLLTACLAAGLASAYVLRTRTQGNARRWSSRKSAVVISLLGLAVAAAGLRFYAPPCNHLAVDWYGLLPEHRCPYLAPMELMLQLVYAQEEFERRHRPMIKKIWELEGAGKVSLDEAVAAERKHQYASSVDQLVDEGLLPRALVEVVRRDGFVTRIHLEEIGSSVTCWVGCCSSPRYAQAVVGMRRWYPSRVN